MNVDNPERLIYVSSRMGRNLWQEYRVYCDRIELQSWLLFSKVRIPIDEIQAIEIRPPFVFAELFRGKGAGPAFALKIDSADLFRHLVIKRASGIFKFIAFTPDDPERFLQACESIMPAAVIQQPDRPGTKAV